MSSTPAGFRQIPVKVAAFLLWLLAAILGLAAIYYLHDLSITAYAAVLLLTGARTSIQERAAGVLIGQVVTILAGLAWVVVIIWLGEYQLKHVGERRGWIFFAWVLGIEILLVVLGVWLA